MSKILIVDDNGSIIKVMRLLLAREGYQVRSSDDEGVFHLAESWQPSVILMDVHLPKLDGIDACKRLKESPITSGIPIILLTADANAPELTLEGNTDDLLVKPFRNAELLEKIRKHIGTSA